MARIWADFMDHRPAITAASNAIDRLLGDDPENSVDLHEGLRSLDVVPLHILFEIQGQDRMVRVAKVRFIPTDTSGHERNGEEKTPGPGH